MNALAVSTVWIKMYVRKNPNHLVLSGWGEHGIIFLLP
jgi:hypothetical protein